LGNNEKALESYQQALNSSDNYYGTQSNESARSCQLVTDSYYNMGNMDKAIEYLQRAIDIYCAIGASDTPEVQQLKEIIQKLKETKP
jgi:tetratricopeptide (TPR) repeat protein